MDALRGFREPSPGPGTGHRSASGSDPDVPNQRVSPESVDAEIVGPDDADLAGMRAAEFETDVVDADVVATRLPSRLMSGTGQRLVGAAATTSVPLTRMSARAGGLARRHPREAAAVILLAAGAAYPAVWLAGALVALTGKIWDRRDRWTGLALPLGFVILGAVLIPALLPHGSASQYAYSVWRMAGWLSRALAIISAGYLAWRLHRGRRKPKVPPRNNPHRYG
jgi:hypothetical protein